MMKEQNQRLSIEKGQLYTKSEIGLSVYGEPVRKINQEFIRYWDPKRSKLSAGLKNGLKFFPFTNRSNVLYLGASTGTTVSHISDVCNEGRIYAVELSYESFEKLLALSRSRSNIYPILEDANLTEKFNHFVENVDIIYQDIAQRNQVQIFNLNAKEFKGAKFAILIIKVRAISSRKKEREILEDSIKEIEDFRVKQIVDLKPYDKANYLLYLER